jgi:hypothetical protein
MVAFQLRAWLELRNCRDCATAWGTVSVVMKDRLASALASGDTQAIIDLASRMGASAAAQSSAEEEAPAQPYRQAVASDEANEHRAVPYQVHELHKLDCVCTRTTGLLQRS